MSKHNHDLAESLSNIAKVIEKMDKNQLKQNLAQSFRELGHLVFGSLFLTQIFSQSFSFHYASVGAITLVLLYILAYHISKE